MSLEKLVKEFAERVRAELLARIEAEKNIDTAVVKWQGFNDDGNPIVKNLDKIDTAKGLGNVAQKKGTKLIFDKNGSAEYKRRKKAKPELIKKQDIPLVLRTRRISRPPLLTADLFEVNFNILFDVPITAFYMVTYSTQVPKPERDLGQIVGAGDDWTGAYNYPNPYSLSEVVSDYTKEATQGITYRISVGAVAAHAYSLFGAYGTAAAEASGLGIDLSVEVETSGTPLNVEATDIAINIEQTTSGGTIDKEASGSMGTLGSSTTVYYTGNSEANIAWGWLTFPRAVYYFQTPENIATGNNQIREIDLNTIVPNRVYTSRIVHNYASREGDDVFVYTIYYAVDVDMSQKYQITSLDTTALKDDNRYQGKVTKYIIHTKLNLLTGEYEHKINESPNTGNLNAGTGQMDAYDTTSDGVDGTWLFQLRAAAASSGSGGAPNAICDIDLFLGTDYYGFAESPQQRFSFNPEPVWRESYEGDWIYVHRNLSYPGGSSQYDFDVRDFLNSSYKNSFFWRGIDGPLYSQAGIYSQDTDGFIRRKDITGSGWEGNTPLTGTYSDIQGMVSFTNSSPGSSFNWSDYFDGSVPNVPDDYSSWRNWTFMINHYTDINNLLLPNFTLAENVLESGSKTGDRVSWYRSWFNFVPLDSIRIVSYEITTEVISGLNQQIVTLITASQGYTFHEGDAIEISEDAAINGQYNIYQVNSSTQFKISIPGSTNTSGAVASTGIAAKLPPAT